MLPYYILQTINIGPLTLNVWGLFAGLAFAVALFVALIEAKRKNINENYIFDLAILILAGGVVGARAAYILENWDYFSQNSGEILSFKEGGLMFFGGAIGAAMLAVVYLKFKKLNGWNIIDSLTPSFAIGEFIGRIGCTLACSHLGVKTILPWAQEYIDGSLRHPIAIYMSLNGLAMFIVFWFLRKKIKIKGALFLFFVLWYSGIRFFLDFLRCGDLKLCDPRYSGYTPSQYISLGAFILALIFLIYRYKKYMAEQQNDNGADNKEEKANENKDSQGSAVSHTEAEEVIFESKASDAGGSAKLKDKISAVVKKPWAMVAALLVALALGAIGASVYYNSIYYGNMFEKSLFSFQGKTWVSHDMPIINLTVVNDASCKECATEDIIKGLKAGLMPTSLAREVDYNSKEGKDAISKFSIKSLPAFIFDSNVEKLDSFSQLSQVLEKKDSQYYLNYLKYPELRIRPGKFLDPLQVSPTDRVQGPADAPITIIEFSDFQCPYCKIASEAAKQVLAAYPDKIRFAFKEFPLASIHANAEYAAEVAECAGDQGKFWEMHDLLFANQETFSKDTPERFKVLANKYANQLKLDKKTFDDCLFAGKYKAKIEADSKLAGDYSVSGTPAFFINGQLMSAEPTIDNFKAAIDELLKAK